ncbi:alpha-hydroxy acid oxidase [Paracoccus laeviglucosivorans]|uniref:L-lactate dehydrogenase (Cytochrome) n=1 Tax=Paracoccus laeviglucosivorans TaxID=1197861 RepID=A0A521BIV4_9RHOB|nr:alpha-hydroxy acid oxidase [Paracoccus laeviglucosivorans]SMO47068.1 L-lactate dehydrogenase (cytochrome) [Paracoccus laeviglucosivorans]
MPKRWPELGGPSFLDFDEARVQARAFLPRALFDYIDRGTEGEVALRALHDGFSRRRVVPRVLRPVSAPDPATTLMGRRHDLPFVVAPTALAGMVRYDGEVAMARAARDIGVPFCVSTQSSTAIEAIAAGAPGADLWFQLYVWRDREQTWKLLDRVAAQGVSVLLLTVDTPASPKKVHNIRNGFGVPLRPSGRLALDLALHPRWTIGVMGRYRAQSGLPSYAHYPGGKAVTQAISDPRFALDMVLDAAFLAELRRRWPGRLILKGVMDPRDVQMAFDAGCDAVVVSTHGGRNHDGAANPLEMLPAIRQAVGPGRTLLADSGVRRGSDAAKLLAAGADGVLLGRAPLYGLAAAGDAGVRHMLTLLADELRGFMAFSGAPDLRALAGLDWLG